MNGGCFDEAWRACCLENQNVQRDEDGQETRSPGAIKRAVEGKVGQRGRQSTDKRNGLVAAERSWTWG